MFCTNCGAELEESAAFCTRCGLSRDQMDSEAEATVVIETGGQSDLPAFHMGKTQELPTVAYRAPQAPSKPSKRPGKGLVVALSCLLVALLAGGGFLCFKLFAPADTGEVASNDAPAQSMAVQNAEKDSTASTSTNDQTNTGSTATTVTSPATPTTSSNKYINANPTSDYVLPNSSSAYVSTGDLSSLSEDQLRIARNEIAARHGRLFNDGDLQEYFNSKSWYSGTMSPDEYDANMGSILNDCENANSKTIRDYENAHGYN